MCLFFPAYRIEKDTYNLIPIPQFTNVSCTLLIELCAITDSYFKPSNLAVNIKGANFMPA